MPHASHRYLLGQRPQTQSVTSPKQVRHQRPGICSTSRKTENPGAAPRKALEQAACLPPNRLKSQATGVIATAGGSAGVGGSAAPAAPQQQSGPAERRPGSPQSEGSPGHCGPRRRNLADDWQVNSRWEGRHLKSSDSRSESAGALGSAPRQLKTRLHRRNILQRRVLPATTSEALHKAGRVRQWRGPGFE
jgi:hypothetical protein